VQWWADPVAEPGRPCSWLRLIRNGQDHPKFLHQFSGVVAQQRLAARWADLQREYEPTALTEERMWSKLRDLTGIEQEQCLGEGCAGGLPVSWNICPLCGRNTRNVSSGSRSGVNRRPAVFLDLRTGVPGTDNT